MQGAGIRGAGIRGTAPSRGDGHRTRPLHATPVERLRAACAPGWRRTMILRRAAAAAMLAAAVVLMFRGDPAARAVPVLVAARDVAAGATVGPGDVTVARRAAADVPGGALSSAEDAVGRTVAAPLRAGEALTDVRLLGAPLARAAAGVADARVVTVRLSDPALADIVHAGDLVDIIAAPPEEAEDAAPPTAARGAVTLAIAAPVVLVPPAPDARSARGRILLVALPAREAGVVASASMTRALTVTMH